MKHKLFTTIVTIALIIGLSPTAIASTGDYDPDLIKTPTDVRAKSTKKGTIVLRWDKVPEATSYMVYRSTKLNGKYKRVKTTKGTKFTDKKIRPKKTYYYKVSAKMPNGGLTVSSCDSKVVKAKMKIKKSFKVKAYAYTGGGTTKVGKKAKVGRIAVDPDVIPLGTWLYVEGYGVCQACDTGGNINGKTIDVYKNNEKQVRKWGVKKPRVYILGK